MSRNLISELKLVIPTTRLGDDTLQSFLDTASIMVDRISNGCGSDLSEETLTQIEKYLGAHYATQAEPSLSISQEKFENASKTYNTSAGNGSGITGTSFGQTANALSNGCLAELDKPISGIFSLGMD